MTAHEAKALIDDVEDAARVVVAGALGLALQDEFDEDVLALALVGIDLEVAGNLAELRDAHLAQVADVEVVPLAGGFELLLLFVFGDRGARRRRWALVVEVVGCGIGRAGRGRVRACGKGHLRVKGDRAMGARGIAAAARVPVGMTRSIDRPRAPVNGVKTDLPIGAGP